MSNVQANAWNRKHYGEEYLNAWDAPGQANIEHIHDLPISSQTAVTSVFKGNLNVVSDEGTQLTSYSHALKQ